MGHEARTTALPPAAVAHIVNVMIRHSPASVAGYDDDFLRYSFLFLTHAPGNLSLSKRHIVVGVVIMRAVAIALRTLAVGTGTAPRAFAATALRALPIADRALWIAVPVGQFFDHVKDLALALLKPFQPSIDQRCPNPKKDQNGQDIESQWSHGW